MKYGLIGEHLGHSFSKDIHNMIGDYQYELKEIPPADLDAFMQTRDFLGINVTIPYKQAVIPYLDSIDDAAKIIGAVNTIVNKNGKLYGYNTDFYGMKSLLEKMGLSVKGKNVLILGNGGTSKTALALVQSLGCGSVAKVSRHPEEDLGAGAGVGVPSAGANEGILKQVQNDDGNSSKGACFGLPSAVPGLKIPIISYEEAEKRTETNIIINTTPCGMFPKTDAQPISLDNFPKLEGVLDAIYNPNCTNLILDAKKRGFKAEGGLFMLVGQAIKAAEFFFEKPVGAEKADQIFKAILGRKENIVLIGMPASGKTTVGRQIARLLGRQLIDSDAEIVKKQGCEISEIFAKEGEKYFRKIEAQEIAELSEKNGCVISTGGGVILNPQNVHNLKKNGRIYFINRPLQELLPTADRPTANSSEKIKGLFESRFPLYKAAADVVVTGGIGPRKIALQIIKNAGLEGDILPSADISGGDNGDIAVFEKSLAKGQVSAPPSKSLAHRSLICGALADGESTITNVDFSEDILATLDCLKTLGAKIQVEGNSVKICGIGDVAGSGGKMNALQGKSEAGVKTNASQGQAGSGGKIPDAQEKSLGGGKISGSQGEFVVGGKIPDTQGQFSSVEKLIFNCRESGSTLRFFIPLAINFAQKSEFYGSKVLMTRPQTIYEDLCSKNGITFERGQEKIIINTNGKKLEAGNYTLAGNISSQFITGLLFVLPLLQGDSTLNLIPPVESRPYIDLTLQAMADFGVKAQWLDENTLAVKGNQKYKSREIAVEGDYSNAAFLDVFNTLGGSVQVNGLYDHSLQGDRVYRQMFDELVKTCPTLDISDCPDLGPILFVVAASHNGGIFTGTKRLAIKESDRGKIMCQELAKFGIKTRWSENQIVIEKGVLKKPKEIIRGHNDHRIVMALSTLLTVTGGEIDDAHAVKKSFPGYFDVIKKLGIKMENNKKEV